MSRTYNFEKYRYLTKSGIIFSEMELSIMYVYEHAHENMQSKIDNKS
jgi:hypothetical protein